MTYGHDVTYLAVSDSVTSDLGSLPGPLGPRVGWGRVMVGCLRFTLVPVSAAPLSLLDRQRMALRGRLGEHAHDGDA